MRYYSFLKNTRVVGGAPREEILDEMLFKCRIILVVGRELIFLTLCGFLFAKKAYVDFSHFFDRRSIQNSTFYSSCSSIQGSFSTLQFISHFSTNLRSKMTIKIGKFESIFNFESDLNFENNREQVERVSRTLQD